MITKNLLTLINFVGNMGGFRRGSSERLVQGAPHIAQEINYGFQKGKSNCPLQGIF